MGKTKLKIPEGIFCYSSSVMCDYVHAGEKHNFKYVCEKYNKKLIVEGGCIEKLKICKGE